MVILVLIIIAVFEIEKTKGYQIYNESQGSSFGVMEREESDEMLIPVGMFDFYQSCSFLVSFCLLLNVLSHEILALKTATNFFVDTNDGDFVVKFQGRNVSLTSLIERLRNLNITPFQTEDFLKNVNNHKHLRTHSCEGRCYFEERSHSKTCYCDLACVSWGDCCLDFHLR